MHENNNKNINAVLKIATFSNQWMFKCFPVSLCWTEHWTQGCCFWLCDLGRNEKWQARMMEIEADIDQSDHSSSQEVVAAPQEDNRKSLNHRGVSRLDRVFVAETSWIGPRRWHSFTSRDYYSSIKFFLFIFLPLELLLKFLKLST